MANSDSRPLQPEAAAQWEAADIMRGLYGDGVTGLKGAFDRVWVEGLHQDIDALFAVARAAPGGALPRGPERYYVEVAPEQIRGFVDIATHPWFVAVCETVLGPEWKIVEVGFDIPGPGARDQPWHRDFAAPEATTLGRRLNSLAFNITAVDTREDMGPFEVALGTQWDDLRGCPDPMFPPREFYSRYEARAVRKYPQMGDISARSALTIHRGTANQSELSRPVLVVGVDAPDANNAAHHDLQMTHGYAARLPHDLRRHITYRAVDALKMVVQAHTIPGLLKAYED
jgi:hypothetical protein